MSQIPSDSLTTSMQSERYGIEFCCSRAGRLVDEIMSAPTTASKIDQPKPLFHALLLSAPLSY